MNKEEMIGRAVEAHEVAETARNVRRKVFKQALAGPVTLQEIADATGLTVGKVRGILRG